MKRILHISKCYPFSKGTALIARDCVNALKDNYEQKVIVFNGKGNQIEQVLLMTLRLSIAKVSSQLISLSYRKRFKSVLDEFHPGIIFHYFAPFVVSILLREIKKDIKPMVCWQQDIIGQKFLRIFFNDQNKKLLKRKNMVTAISIKGKHKLIIYIYGSCNFYKTMPLISKRMVA